MEVPPPDDDDATARVTELGDRLDDGTGGGSVAATVPRHLYWRRVPRM